MNDKMITNENSNMRFDQGENVSQESLLHIILWHRWTIFLLPAKTRINRQSTKTMTNKCVQSINGIRTDGMSTPQDIPSRAAQ